MNSRAMDKKTREAYEVIKDIRNVEFCLDENDKLIRDTAGLWRSCRELQRL